MFLDMLEQRTAGAVDQAFRSSGRTGAEEYEQRMIERQARPCGAAPLVRSHQVRCMQRWHRDTLRSGFFIEQNQRAQRRQALRRLGDPGALLLAQSSAAPRKV